MSAGGQQLYCIIGDPVDQVRSPQVFNALFRDRGVNAVMVPLHVSAANLEASLKGLHGIRNLRGVVVTVPHKLAAATMLRNPPVRVAIAGAANVLRPTKEGWEGELFDGEGFARGLGAQQFSLEGKICAIVGAGGAGSAIALALIGRGIRALSLWDVDERKAAALAARLAPHSSAPIHVQPPGPETELAVNATPLGMRPEDPLPFDVSVLRAGSLVGDAIMKPPVTRLLTTARALGCSTLEGRHMLDRQVDMIWEFFNLP
jgi:shikimate dehydrogenase